MVKDERRLLYKYVPLTLFVSVRKGLLRVLLRDGVGDRTETAIFWPYSYGHQRCVFLVLLMLNRRPGGSLCWLSLLHLSNFSGPQLIRALRAPLRRAFSTTTCLLTRQTPTVWLLVLTELYNSSTPTQSPTQSLEWHVWSSSSGNNCHAVQRSLSSGVSVYECTMGFFTLSHFISQIPPTRFLSITGHEDVSLPSGASLWNGIFARVEGQNTTEAALRKNQLFGNLPPITRTITLGIELKRKGTVA